MTRRLTALTEAQQKLLDQYPDLPAEEAKRFARKWRRFPEIVHDLLSMANDGYVAAARTWDATKGPSFEHYARWRVRCTIRARAAHAVVRAHRAAASASEVEHHEIDGSLPETSQAGDESIEHALGDTPDTAKQRLIVWARDSVDRTTAASLLRAELRMQPHPPGGLEALIARQDYVSRIAALANALPTLTKEERRIVVLHYVEECSLREIAQTDGVDPKKVQDIHEGAKKRLERELLKLKVTQSPPIEGRPSGFELSAAGVLGMGEPDEPETRVS